MDALTRLTDEVLAATRRTYGDPARLGAFWSATWTAAESTDSNLSSITLQTGEIVRYVPRLDLGGTWPPAVGDVVLVLKVGSSMTIVGKLLGDRNATS